MFISKNVVFHELILPYPSSSSTSSTSNWQYFSPSSSHPCVFDEPDATLSSSSAHPVVQSHSPLVTDTPLTTTYPIITSPSPPYIPPPLRVSTRNKVTPTYLQDYICIVPSTSHANNSHIQYPISNFVSHKHLTNSHSVFSMSLISCTEPKSHSVFAMSLISCTETINGDWEIRPLPQPITTNHISLTSDKLPIFLVLEPMKIGLETAVASSAAALNSLVIQPKSWGDLADEESNPYL